MGNQPQINICIATFKNIYNPLSQEELEGGYVSYLVTRCFYYFICSLLFFFKSVNLLCVNPPKSH